MLTDVFVRSAPPGVHWDKGLRGFGLRVGKTRRTFIVLVASGRRKAIGVWPHLSLSDARRRARTLLAEKTLGRTHPTHTAFEDALNAYLSEAERTLRPLSYGLYRRLLKAHYPFGRQNAGDITPKQILRSPPQAKQEAGTPRDAALRHQTVPEAWQKMAQSAAW